MLLIKLILIILSIHIINAKNFCVCVCIIKLLCHFWPDLAQILNKAMNSKEATSKPVPGADFIQLLILLRNYFYALLLERHMIDKCSCEAKSWQPIRLRESGWTETKSKQKRFFLEFNFLFSSGLKQGLVRYKLNSIYKNKNKIFIMYNSIIMDKIQN